MLKNVRSLVQSANKGEGHTAYWHKTSLPVPIAGRIIDLSMGAGTPKYNAYVGAQAAATPLIGSGNDGIYLGAQPPSGLKRYINRTLIQPLSTSLVNAGFYLLDYTMFYPLIDGDDLDLQLMDNTQTLPRHTDGRGVRIMLTCTTPMTANANAVITYTNQDGVADRQVTVNINGVSAQTGYGIVRGTNSTDAVTPFVPLANGDTGVRSIESVQLLGSTGGFFCAVLVKPLLTIQAVDGSVCTESLSVQHRGGSIPAIENGAYLNWICTTQNTTALTPFRGELEMIWQ